MVQTVKPRARQGAGLWMVHGLDIAVYDPCFEEALRVWHVCILYAQTGRV